MKENSCQVVRRAVTCWANIDERLCKARPERYNSLLPGQLIDGALTLGRDSRKNEKEAESESRGRCDGEVSLQESWNRMPVADSDSGCPTI